MKKYFLLLVNMVLIVQLYGQTYTDKKGKEHLWGKVSLKDLTEGEYGKWFTENSKDYKSKLTLEDGKWLKDCNVKIFLGTWCGDTKYLVPKFIKSWKEMGLQDEQLELIALHHEGDNYKQGPQKETIGLNIHKVPTFLFEKEDKEIGRIVERTIFDLDTDIMQIAKGMPYEERYQGVAILDRIMNEVETDSLFLKANLNKVFREIRREVSTSSELNAYGYVLKAQGETRKAEFVLMLNRYIFPYNPEVRNSYGEILMVQEKWDEAASEYEEVIRLKGPNEDAVNKLHTIYSKLEDLKDADKS